MHKVETWRSLLETIIRDPREKQRLTDELHVTPITLTRWVNGESDPRPQNLRHLISVLPQHREQFLDLLKEEKGSQDILRPLLEDAPREIPSAFYEEVLATRASTASNIRFWSISKLILDHAIEQLDPQKQGMAIIIARCMPPSGPFNKIRSLREIVGRGTPPWARELEHSAIFLGVESLAGNVATLCRSTVMQNLQDVSATLAIKPSEFENSVAIYPILYAGRIAGVFLISSYQFNSFLTPSTTKLAQQYTDLAALAFEPEEFYESEQIALQAMPSEQIQRDYLAKNYRRALTESLAELVKSGQRTNNLDADLCVWQRLEEELLRHAIA